MNSLYLSLNFALSNYQFIPPHENSRMKMLIQKEFQSIAVYMWCKEGTPLKHVNEKEGKRGLHQRRIFKGCGIYLD